ncbi:hypothetical protein [Vibrio ouci]|uniref:hypothetical protein n=1 Tax=Vibrio ouci TaxID=2499078 RepID=UPI001FC9B34D|nr:hypothetical protein [Vibrio ouci]
MIKQREYRCPIWKDPKTCTCPSCDNHRKVQASRAAIETATRKNFASGSKFASVHIAPEPVVPKETTREKIERQRQERYEEAEKGWAKLQAEKQNQFLLGWTQNKQTRPLEQVWEELFTAETTNTQKRYIKQCNVHLNNPVKQGEIIIVPTSEPTTPKDKQALAELKEEATAASKELGKLSDEHVSMVSRHLELLDHYANQQPDIQEADTNDNTPDLYAHASTGVGMATAAVQQHLNNINGVLLEINDLYAGQVAMASRTGGVNYGSFVSQRAELFKKLDGSFAALSKRTVQLPVYTQVKRNLKLSTKSVIHNADEILKSGFVKNLGKRIANVSIGVSATKGVGYIGLGLGAASGVNNIYEACKVDGTGNCSKTTSKEVVAFFGGAYLGGKMAAWAVGGTLLLLGSASAPVVAVASIGAFVTGGTVGGMLGSSVGKELIDGVYELYDWVVE